MSSGFDLFPAALRMLGIASSCSFPHPSKEERSLLLTQMHLGRKPVSWKGKVIETSLITSKGHFSLGEPEENMIFFKPDMLKEFTPCSHSDQSRRLLRHHGHHLSSVWASAKPEAVTTRLTNSHSAPSENKWHFGDTATDALK